MAISIASIYKQELAAIEEEQKGQEAIYEKQKEASKMLGGGFLQAGAYIGKKGKEFSEKQLEESFQYIENEHLRTAPKYTEFAAESGPGKDTLWGKTEEYLGLDFGGPGETGKIGLSEKYISSGIESGSGLQEFGISPESLTKESLFADVVTPDRITKGAPVPPPDPNTGFVLGSDPTTVAGKAKIAEYQAANPDKLIKGTTTAAKVGQKSKIMGELGGKSFELGEAVLLEGGKVSLTSAKDLTSASQATAGPTAAASAGKLAAGVGIATGGLQVAKGISEQDPKDMTAGALKGVGSYLTMTGAGAPIGLAMTAVGTLLDFV